MTPQTSFIAVSAAGQPIRTFDSRDLAINWWESAEGVCRFPGASLQAVTEQTIVVRRTLRRDKQLFQGAA